MRDLLYEMTSRSFTSCLNANVWMQAKTNGDKSEKQDRKRQKSENMKKKKTNKDEKKG